MRHPRTTLVATALLVALLCAPPQALAGQPPAAVRRAEAQDRFRRGIDLYAEGDFTGAMVEFTRAYELAPTFKLLYNLGQISYQLQDYATALEHFTTYLSEGGDQIPDDRRREVEQEIPRLRRRIGALTIQVDEVDSEILVDDVFVGRSPLSAPVAVNVGSRRVEIVPRTGDLRAQVVDVAGGETVTVRFARPIPRLNRRTGGGASTEVAQAKTPAVAVAAVAAPASLPAAPDPVSASVHVADAPPAGRGRAAAWVGWGLTAACALGAGITGGEAFLASRDLQSALDSYPASASDVANLRQREHSMSLASDGLLVGTAVLAAVSFYLAFGGSSEPAPDTASRVALVQF